MRQLRRAVGDEACTCIRTRWSIVALLLAGVATAGIDPPPVYFHPSPRMPIAADATVLVVAGPEGPPKSRT